jgi:hypothetical protein
MPWTPTITSNSQLEMFRGIPRYALIVGKTAGPDGSMSTGSRHD